MTTLHLQTFHSELPPVIVRGEPGRTVGQLLRDAVDGMELSDALVVQVGRGLGSHEVPAHLWDRLRPKEGTVITVTRMPGNSGTVRTIASIAVIALSVWAGNYVGAAKAAGGLGLGAGWAAAAQIGVAMLGNLAINAALPPPSPDSGQQGRWNALTGSGNVLAQDAPIPCVIGASRFFPMHAASPYQETQGTESYHRYMFDLGFLTAGAVVSDIKIGDTPIDDYEDVEYEITTTPTLYTNDVAETLVNAVLSDGDSETRTTAAVTDEIGVDLFFPEGLFGMNGEGKKARANVFFKIEYRLAGSSDAWVMPGAAEKLTSSSMWKTDNTSYTAYPFVARVDHRDPFTGSFRWIAPTPGAQYEVRVTRSKSEWGDFDNAKAGEETTWTILRSIRHANPSTTGTTKLAMRIRASDQLTGQLSTLSCHVAQAIPVYDEGTDTWTPTLTTNTAWVALWLMRECPAFHTHAADSRIDLPAWLDYADFCEANDLNTLSVLDTVTTAGEYLRDICANSMARFSDGARGTYSVIFDDGTKTASGALTSLEAGNFQWSRPFVRRAHALKVRFRNPDADWNWDTIIVPDDGYSFNGLDAHGNASSDPEPTRFESLELRHAASAHQAWKVARMQMGQARYQPATCTFDTDWAGLRHFRGDVVVVETDVMDWGVGTGWVTSVDGTTVVLDQELTTTSGKTYTAQIRRVDAITGEVLVDTHNVTPHAVVTNTFYFDSPPTVAVGDALILGETGKLPVEVMITNRRNAADKHFSFDGVAYDARVAAYWSNPPATITSAITGKRYLEPPDAPEITVTLSDPMNDTPDDAGVTIPETYVGIRQTNGYVVDGFVEQKRYR